MAHLFNRTRAGRVRRSTARGDASSQGAKLRLIRHRGRHITINPSDHRLLIPAMGKPATKAVRPIPARGTECAAGFLLLVAANGTPAFLRESQAT